jgi:hypothetical protein
MIDEAIDLFECSRTGKNASDKGPDIVSFLRRQAKSDQIQWTPLGANLGESVDLNLDGPNIKINERFRFNVPATSIILAHEGLHRVINDHSLDEEILSREVQDDYYQELTIGVVCGKLGTVRIVNIPKEFADLRSWRAKDQLIDYVLSMNIYLQKLTSGWVRQNITKFGGLRNRWATTRGNYIRLLAARPDDGALILDSSTPWCS